MLLLPEKETRICTFSSEKCAPLYFSEAVVSGATQVHLSQDGYPVLLFY